MLQVLYRICQALGWNNGRTFPFEFLFQKKDAFRGGWSILLRYVPNFSEKNSFNFLEADWDYLIVLDACRYDLFKEINKIPGTLYKKQSVGSMTMDWARNAIKNDYKDIVLVTANPFLSTQSLNKKPFFKNIPAWDVGWDDELNVTPPWAMTEISKKAVKNFPDKKIIFWYMQPHHPFINSNLDYGWNMRDMVLNKKKGLKSEWTAVKSGELSIEKVWDAYEKNLIFTMPHVEKLVNNLKGKIVITSDHGEGFGEMGLFCHPKMIHIPPLVDVPYLEINKK